MKNNFYILCIISFYLYSCNGAAVPHPTQWGVSYVNSMTNTLVDSTEQVTFWYEIDGDSMPMLYDEWDRVNILTESCDAKSDYDVKYLWIKNLSYEVYRNRKIKRFFIDYAGTTDTLYFNIQDKDVVFTIVPDRLNDKPLDVFRDCDETGFILLHLTGGQE